MSVSPAASQSRFTAAGSYVHAIVTVPPVVVVAAPRVSTPLAVSGARS